MDHLKIEKTPANLPDLLRAGADGRALTLQKPDRKRLVRLGDVVAMVCPELTTFYSRSELGEHFAGLLDRLLVQGVGREERTDAPV